MNTSTRGRTLLAAALCACVVGLWPMPAANAGHATPPPQPSAGGEASEWVCRDDKDALGNNVGQHCTVTTWSENPPAPSATASTVGLASDQFDVLWYAGALLVFLTAMQAVGAWRR